MAHSSAINGPANPLFLTQNDKVTDMTLNDVLYFDTETTGVPERSASWETDYAEYPHIVQLAWMNEFRFESHIIRPDGWEIPDEAVSVHGITTERALQEGEPFAYVIDRFISDCLESGLLCGHNIHFDTSIIKANILRELGKQYYVANRVEDALHKGKRIDTMRSSMKWVDARMANGRLKFPNLTELYSRCFPGETFPAHDAMSDTKAVARCLPVLLKNGLVELKVKEYPDENPENARNGQIRAIKEENDKLPIQTAKAPEIEDLVKITDSAAELLEQNEF